MSSKRRLACCLLAGGLFGLLGCGEPVGQVAGKVLWKNQPVAGAELVFQPDKAPDERYSGVSGDDGTYHVSYRTKSGLPVGRYRVVVTRYSLPSGKPLPLGEEGDVLKGDERTLKHSYVFEQEIAAGANAIDFELSRGKKKPKEE